MRRAFTIVVAIGAVAAACQRPYSAKEIGAAPTLGLIVRHSDPYPTSLGARGLAKVAHKKAAVTIVDSVFKRWGWRTALADGAGNEIQTAWLYLPRGTFTPGSGSQCELGSFVGVRFFVTARDSASATPEYFMRAEAKVFDDTPRVEAERAARTAFSAVGADIARVIRSADERPDVFGAAVDQVWGRGMIAGLDSTAVLCGR